MEEKPVIMNLWRWVAMAVSTFGGVGLSPIAPGTFGTVAAVVVYFLVQPFGFEAEVGLFAITVALGFWSAGVACAYYGVKDPQPVVIDEVAGYLLTMLFLPHASWVWALVGFGLFRLFDIWKPWPVNWLDRTLPCPWGVMLDDLAAGLYAGVLLAILGYLF
ncbi:MAG: phosphatidylglycerophosphatase A [Magnetococcales bacterium]|nr:phosphatidylglycerophosphatase A [Magnetococcales bacterium]